MTDEAYPKFTDVWVRKSELARLRALNAELVTTLKGARLFVYAQRGVAMKNGWPLEHFNTEISEYDSVLAKHKESTP